MKGIVSVEVEINSSRSNPRLSEILMSGPRLARSSCSLHSPLSLRLMAITVVGLLLIATQRNEERYVRISAFVGSFVLSHLSELALTEKTRHSHANQAIISSSSTMSATAKVAVEPGVLPVENVKLDKRDVIATHPLDPLTPDEVRLSLPPSILCVTIKSARLSDFLPHPTTGSDKGYFVCHSNPCRRASSRDQGRQVCQLQHDRASEARRSRRSWHPARNREAGGEADEEATAACRS